MGVMRIEWTFEEDHMFVKLAGKTFQADVLFIDNEEKHYGVVAEYGQDYIDFNVARIL
jgi:hypothetical protein